MNRLASPLIFALFGSLGLALCASGCGNEDSSVRQDPPVQVAAPDSATKEGSPAHSMPMHGGTEHGDVTAAPKVVKTGPFDKSFDGIHFAIPAGWDEVENPTPDFIDARFQISTSHGPVKLTFSSNAGGIDVNIKRWIGQFQISGDTQPTVGDLKVDGATARWVDVRGEFTGGGMGAVPVASGPVERMLGVAIPLGARDFYLKLTGTDAAVSEIRDAFREFVRSARISSGGSSGK
jgi:hypothetical protein